MTEKLDLRSLDVIVTADCNLRCGYCYQNAKRPGQIVWHDLRAGLDLVLASSRPEVHILFIGGEPLLAFPLVRRAVRYVEKRKPTGLIVHFDISTNGTLTGPNEARFLAHHGFEVQLSFDGVPAAQDRRGKGTFAALDRLLGCLRTQQPLLFMQKLNVSVTLVPETVRFLARSIEYFLEQGVPNIVVTPALNAQPRWRREDVDRLDREFARIHAACLRHYRRFGTVPLRWFRRWDAGRRRPPISDWFCGVGSGQALTLDVDGQLTGCVLFARSYQRFPETPIARAVGALQLGHVRDRGLADRLTRYGDAVQRIGVFDRRGAKYSVYGRCATCRYRPECYFCPVCIIHQPGNNDPDRVPDFVCAFSRVSAKYRRRFPAQPDASVMVRGRRPVPRLVRDVVRRAREIADAG